MDARVAVVQRQCLVVMLGGLLELVAGFVEVAQVVPGICQFGVQQGGLLAVLKGRVIVARHVQGHAQVAVCKGITRLDCKLLLKALNGQTGIASVQGNDGGDLQQGGIVRYCQQQIFGQPTGCLQITLLVEANDLLDLSVRGGGCVRRLCAGTAAAFVLLAAPAGAGGIPGRAGAHIYSACGT